MLNLMEGIIPEYSRKGVIRGPSGSSVTGIVPTNAYPTSVPSAFVVIGANGDSIYERLMKAIGRPELTGSNYSQNQHRVTRKTEIEEAISSWTKHHTPEEACKAMNEARVPVGRIMNVKDIMENEHVRERGMVETVHISSRDHGPLEVNTENSQGWTLDISQAHPLLECDTKTRWAGPDLGSHNEEIFSGLLGLSHEDISRMQSDGIIGQ